MYGKHYESMYTGSMVGAGVDVFAVWGYVISHQKPPDFTVELNAKLLAFIFGEPQEKIDAAILKLCSPDESSRSPEEGGRRLLHLGAFLYQVVNGEKYYRLKCEEQKRAYWRLKQGEHRELKKKNGDAPGEFGSEHKKVLEHLNQSTGRQFRSASLSVIRARMSEPGVSLDGVLKMIDRQVARWKGDAKMEEYLRPSTLFGKEKFNEYYAARELPVGKNAGNGAGQRVDRNIGTSNEGKAVQYKGLGKVP